MTMFDLDEDTMINLDNTDSVKFAAIEGQKSVIVGIRGQSFIVPISKHKEFFEQITRLGVSPTKQFVSL